MKQIKPHAHNNFTVLPNTIFNDSRLSIEEIGMLCKIKMLYDKNTFIVQDLLFICKEDKTTIFSILQRLRNLGYIEFVFDGATHNIETCELEVRV